MFETLWIFRCNKGSFLLATATTEMIYYPKHSPCSLMEIKSPLSSREWAFQLAITLQSLLKNSQTCEWNVFLSAFPGLRHLHPSRGRKATPCRGLPALRRLHGRSCVGIIPFLGPFPGWGGSQRDYPHSGGARHDNSTRRAWNLQKGVGLGRRDLATSQLFKECSWFPLNNLSWKTVFRITRISTSALL